MGTKLTLYSLWMVQFMLLELLFKNKFDSLNMSRVT